MSDKVVRFTDANGDLLSMWPIGSIYMSVSAIDPATFFGGTWERIQDTFLLAAGSSYAAGATGGEAEHTLAKSELPNESYEVLYTDNRPLQWATSNSGGGSAIQIAIVGTASSYHIGPLGSGAAHNNMPPYLAVYVWKRTA